MEMKNFKSKKKIIFFQSIAEGLRSSPYTVSLLDCTLKNVSFLSNARIFENVSLHGLVISSGEIKRVHRLAFLGIKTPLQALGRLISFFFTFTLSMISIPNRSTEQCPTNGSLEFIDIVDIFRPIGFIKQ